MQLVPTLKSQKILTGNIKNDKYIMGASDMAKFLKTIWGIQIYDKHFDFRKNDTFADCIAYLKTMNEQSKGITLSVQVLQDILHYGRLEMDIYTMTIKLVSTYK